MSIQNNHTPFNAYPYIHYKRISLISLSLSNYLIICVEKIRTNMRDKHFL